MRVSIIGCGAVAATHAAQLRTAGIPIAGVCGSSMEKAREFAATHGAERATAEIESALGGADAAIISSPSALHYEHALRALERGLDVLVELPACSSAAETDHLAEVAARANAVLRCAHTSRYLEPYRRIGNWIQSNRLGEIQHVHYLRCVVPSRRTWADDALVHHAAHPLDLFLHWFGDLEAVAAIGLSPNGPYREISLAARLPNRAPLTVAVSYTAKTPQLRMTVIGSSHTVEALGFRSIESDDTSLEWRGDDNSSFQQAVADQDLEFLDCCQTRSGGIPWADTIRMARHVEAFQKLCNK